MEKIVKEKVDKNFKNTKMTLEELKKAMHEGEVHFKFKKKDGSIREAVGTLLMDIIPAEHHPSDSIDYVQKDDITRYFDVEKSAWRSFINENYIDEDAQEAPECDKQEQCVIDDTASVETPIDDFDIKI